MKRGFTIIELMVSIALVLVLMLGVSKVFQTVSATVAAGSSISDNTRVARAAQSVFAKDFSHAVTTNAPAMLLYSRSRPAFRNAADMDGDRDGNPRTVDLDGDNVEGGPGEVVSAATYNYRNHRVDLFSFFVRDLLRRQTGGTETSNGAAPFIADMTTTEAWVWLGHLRVNSRGTFTTAQDPGQGTRITNPDNFFSTQWILAREQILLKEPESTKIKDNSGADQIYIETTTGANKSPLSYGSNANVGTAELRESRYDLAGTTIDGYRQRLAAFRAPPRLPTDNWWGDIFCSDGRRFQANPFVAKPLTPAIVSQQVPVFIPGCTQFIVEYAGDFVAQNNDQVSASWGQVTNVYTNANGTDGQVDYIVVGVAPNQRKQIRWYGMPRDADGDGRIRVNQPPAPANANQVADVVPLRDIWRLSTTPGLTPCAPFEKFTYTGLDARSTSSLKDYLAAPGDYMAAGAAGKDVDDFYTCAWQATDPKPKMIRITLVIDDPSGRNPNQDGQTFEYVFELP